MAKRARGSVRPGQRRPNDRRPAAPAAAPVTGTSTPAPRPAGLSDAELERAAVLEAQLLEQEKSAEQARKRSRERGAPREAVGTGTIGVRAEVEYAYVRRDLVRIGRLAAIELTILAVLYVLIDVVKVVTIGA